MKTVTATTAAPAAEPSAAAKPSAQNLTIRGRARRLELARKQSTAPAAAANGSPAATSAPANQTTAPAAAQNSPAANAANGKAHGAEAPAPAATNGTENPAEAPPVLAKAAATEPASATSPPNTEADGAEANDATTPIEGEADALTLLEDLENDGTASPDARTEEAWLQQLDEMLQRGDSPKAIKELQKRLHALVDQRDTERMARLDAEKRLAERAETPERESAAAEPGHPVISQIDGAIQQTLNSIEIMDSHLEAVRAAQAAGTDVPKHVTLPNGQVWSDKAGRPIEVTPEQARKWARQYELNLSQLNSRRETTIAEVQRTMREATVQNMELAVVAYPWMRNAKSPEYQEVQALLRQRPRLKQDPQWPVIAGDYIAGKRAREAAAGKATLRTTAPPMTKPKGGNTPPPVGTSPGAGAATGPQDGKATLQKQVQEAREQYRKTGSTKDRANLHALLRQQPVAA